MEPRNLQHSDDSRPGISRRRCGRGFAFRDAAGKPLRDEREKARVKALAVPPAWRDVWICPDPHGHLQATGYDESGRKQYIYHPDWVAWRADSKFAHIIAFASSLPRLRRRVDRDLGAPPGSQQQVLAATVRILDRTLMRVGNQRYTKQNRSYGLTTVRSKHVELNGDGEIKFRFRGKGGKPIQARLTDPQVAEVLRDLEELPGQRVFQYQGENDALHPVTAEKVNAYIREASGGDFSTKDFRTWSATVLTAVALARREPPVSEREARSIINRAVRRAARRLGNTVTVCRESYVHPAVLDGFAGGTLAPLMASIRRSAAQKRSDWSLSPEERAVLAYLKRET